MSLPGLDDEMHVYLTLGKLAHELRITAWAGNVELLPNGSVAIVKGLPVAEHMETSQAACAFMDLVKKPLNLECLKATGEPTRFFCAGIALVGLGLVAENIMANVAKADMEGVATKASGGLHRYQTPRTQRVRPCV